MIPPRIMHAPGRAFWGLFQTGQQIWGCTSLDKSIPFPDGEYLLAEWL